MLQLVIKIMKNLKKKLSKLIKILKQNQAVLIGLSVNQTKENDEVAPEAPREESYEDRENHLEDEQQTEGKAKEESKFKN